MFFDYAKGMNTSDLISLEKEPSKDDSEEKSIYDKIQNLLKKI